MAKPVILLADDNKDFRESTAGFLEATGIYAVRQAASGKEALQLFTEHPAVECFLLDYHMPQETGLDVAAKLNEHAPFVPVILMSAYGGKPAGWVEERARTLKVMYVAKDKDDILDMLRATVRAEEEILIDPATEEQLRRHGFVYADPNTKRLIRQAQKAACTDGALLITGETGVGKTQLAKLIHTLGDREDEPFESVDCGAYSANSQLFVSAIVGHTKGAFTGAFAERAGAFENAGKGTLFLDEIGELTLEAQAALLKVIDEGVYKRLGENRERKAMCRIIAATNKDLHELAAQGAFKHDLLERLKHAYIRIAPLRERPEDIKELVYLYLSRLAHTKNGRLKRIQSHAIAFLERQHWLGNARQLRNVVERAAAETPANEISVGDIAAVLRDETSFADISQELFKPRPTDEATDVTLENTARRLAHTLFDNELAENLDEALSVIERELLIESLKRSETQTEAGRRFWSFAAASKGALRHKIKKFDIDPADYLKRYTKQ